MDPSRSRLVLAGVGVAAALALVALARRPAPSLGHPAGHHRPATDHAPTDASARAPASAPAHGAPTARPDGATTDAGASGLDCANASGLAAVAGDQAVPVERVCDRLRRLGGLRGTTVDRAQARLVLDQLVVAALVRGALQAERLEVSDTELDQRLRERLGDGGAGPGAEVLREQLRERLELEALSAHRNAASLAVSDAEVDAELARGAPGIDRGQGMRVEGWLSRVSPQADADALGRSQRAAEAFAEAVLREAPEPAAARLRLTHLAPFVVGANGVEPDLESAAGGLSEGHWSSAARTRVGWVVLRGLGRSAGDELPAGELRARVRQALERRARQRAQQDVVAALRSNTRVELRVTP
ncbi:MAG: hypothetical protein HY909_04730 [Deltaproteobacteria bacterium]|nr:hypothetical protein [Deltaproteobacteria bacterium]